jgi:Cu-processing system ATP-binding protein
VLVEGRLVADLTQRELSDRLAARGVMRLRLDACPPALLALVQGVAPGTRWAMSQLAIPGTAEVRASALEAVRSGGAEIRGIASDEGRLDTLYRDLAGGAP